MRPRPPSWALALLVAVTLIGCGSGSNTQSDAGTGGSTASTDGGSGGTGGTASTDGGTGGTTATSADAGDAGPVVDGGDAGPGTGDAGSGGDAGDAGDPCSPNPCTSPNRSVCQAQGGQATCSCDPGYHDAGGTCAIDTTCTPTTCGGHGACSVVDGGAALTCACDPGWAPPNCAGCDTGYHDDGMGGCTTDPCLPDPCTAANKTTCAASGTTAVCSCDTGYHDDGMGGCTTDPCLPNPCAAQNKACQAVSGQATCVTPNCDDMNACTTDTVVMGACVHTPVTNGTSCGSANKCSTGQTCQAGACAGGAAVSCDDENPCTTDACVPATGCSHTPVSAGTSCDDGIACTTGDVCNAQGGCSGTLSASCGPTSCTNPTPIGSVIDIPVAHTSATITLGGQALPTTNLYGTEVDLYLRAQDTGQWHSFAYWSYNSALYGPTVDPLVVPGIYDVYYCHNCSTSGAPIASETEAGDAFPSGLRVLQSNVVVGSGNQHLAIDIPVTKTTATITLGGAALPTTNLYGTEVDLYLVAKDTGQWHSFAYWSYNSALYGPTVDPLVVPGTYDVYYCHNCSTSGAPIASETEAGDAFPSGLRILQSGLVVAGATQKITVDIPVTKTTATITLGGAALPTTNLYGTEVDLYLVAKDTGQWHSFAYWSYNSALYGPTVDPLVVPGTYDVYYCHNCSTSGAPIASETEAGDAFPSGLRILQSGLVVAGATQKITVDIPVTKTTATITLGGAALPTTNLYGTEVDLYLVAKDTGQWHSFAYWSYNSALYGPTVDPLVVPGTYDVYYCHNCSTSGAPIASETEAGDAFPSGLRILQSGLVVAGANQHIAVDIPVKKVTETFTLAGQSLPSTNLYGTEIDLYLVAKDTGQWHSLAYWSYNSALYGPTVTPLLVPGAYDVYYCHNCSTSGAPIASETEVGDAFPSGLRILRACISAP